MRWITANQLEAWARGIGSKVQLAGIVSDLIRASGSDIAAMRFPNGDKGQVRGFDGYLISEEAALNIPEGRSYWEFGTNEDYKVKALSDFKNRTGDVSKEDQASTTFVFVTPWTWDSSDPNNKLEDWVNLRKKESSWKDVRYIDGSQLESWLDSRPAVAAWHARNTLKVAPPDGVRSTDEFWHDYAGRFGPPVTKDVLLCERDTTAQQLLDSLIGPSCVLSYIADSPDEVIAFVIAAMRKAKPEVRLFIEARTLVIDSIEAGRQLFGCKNLILLLRNDAARSPLQFSELGSIVVPLGRQQRGGTAVWLSRPSGYSLGMAMRSMGFGDNEALTLARGCGRSLTVLARLRPGGAIQPPEWVKGGPSLLPAILVGAWDASNEDDKKIITEIAAGRPYQEVESGLRQFLRDSDPPFDVEGTIWKVRAPMDAFIHVGHLIGPGEAALLRASMITVFGHVEPDEDLDEVVSLKRPTVSGPSNWLREGLATTLLLLAVWSDSAEVNLGTETGQAFADRILKELPGLTTDHRLIASLHEELPLLAEAAPSPLLWALERLLEGDGELIRPIFHERHDFLFPSSKHTGLLWALETLAWDPDYFRQSVLILARLAHIDPGGRLGNRPFDSLVEIFVLWNPNTNASAEQRLAVLDEVLRVTPDIGWRLIKALLPAPFGTSSPTSKPKLREAGASERVAITYRELGETQVAVIRRALELAKQDDNRWRDLIHSYGNFPPAERNAMADDLDVTLSRLDNDARKRLWEEIRNEVVQHERFRSAKWALPEEALLPLKTLVERYSPTDPLTPFSWLFDTWVLDETGDMAAAEQRRAQALKQVYETGGVDLIFRLGNETKLPYLVVDAIAVAGFSEADVRQLLDRSFTQGPISDLSLGLTGLYHRLAGPTKAQDWLETEFQDGRASAQIVAAHLLAWPDGSRTWSLARRFGQEVVTRYWQTRSPRYVNGSRTDLLRSSLMFLRFGRAAEALQSSFNRLNEIPTKLLFRMLDGVIPEINRGAIKPDTMLNYYIEKGFEALDSRQNTTVIEVAQREYAFLPLLEFSKRNLKIYDLMADDPGFYHMVLRDVFLGRNEKKGEVDKQTESRARVSYSLLSHFSKLPGQTSTSINVAALNYWIDEVRRLGRETDREEVTDSYVGRILAHAPSDVDGGWPHRVVRDQIERLGSPDIERAIQVERFNMRGAHWRQPYDGGGQERELARINNENAKLAAAWPRTSALLRAIAENWEEDAKRMDIDAAQRKLRS